MASKFDTSQTSEQEEAEIFPEDHFDDSAENLYDSDFSSKIYDGSDAHNQSHHSGASSAIPHVRYYDKNDKLTTISEGSEFSEIDPFPGHLRIASRNSRKAESVKSFQSTITAKNAGSRNASKENLAPSYKGKPFDSCDSALHESYDDTKNLFFKPAHQMLDVFDEDAKRVAHENFLRAPDQITDSMLKKQHSWEPSVLEYSPPIISTSAMENKKLDDSRKRSKNLSTNMSQNHTKVLGEFNIRVEEPKNSSRSFQTMEDIRNTSKSVSSASTIQRIPIRRVNKSDTSSDMSGSNSPGVQEVKEVEKKSYLDVSTGRLPVNRPNTTMKKSENEEISPKLPTLEEEEEKKENTLPPSQLDFNRSTIPKIDLRTSSPKEQTDSNPRKELSLMCKSISVIESPKTRQLMSKFQNDTGFTNWPNRHQITRMTTDTLSSSAIDQALNVPGMATLASNDTRLQMNFATRLVSAHRKKVQKPVNTKIAKFEELGESLKNIMSKADKSARRERSMKAEIDRYSRSRQVPNMECTARSIHSTSKNHRNGVLASIAKARTSSRSPGMAHRSTKHESNSYSTPKAASSKTTTPKNYVKAMPKVGLFQESDMGDETFTMPYLKITANVETHKYLKQNFFRPATPIMGLLEKMLEERPENQLEFLKSYVEKL